MNSEDVKEWMDIADNDFDSAILLNESPRKHYEIICYHCAQAVEKYIKAYLISQNIVPQKTHDLRFLNNLCIELDSSFENTITECAFLNKFANDIRYPHKYETNENDADYALSSVEKIRNFKPIHDLQKKYYS